VLPARPPAPGKPRMMPAKWPWPMSWMLDAPVLMCWPVGEQRRRRSVRSGALLRPRGAVDVAEAAPGAQVARVGGVGLYHAAQRVDRLIDGVVGSGEARWPDRREQLLARQDGVGVPDEDLEQVECQRRQGELTAAAEQALADKVRGDGYGTHIRIPPEDCQGRQAKRRNAAETLCQGGTRSRWAGELGLMLALNWGGSLPDNCGSAAVGGPHAPWPVAGGGYCRCGVGPAASLRRATRPGFPSPAKRWQGNSAASGHGRAH
jgi:hypothetical protein